MASHRTRFVAVVIAAMALLMGACGGDSSIDAAPTTTDATAVPAADDGGDPPDDSVAPVGDSNDAAGNVGDAGSTQQQGGAGDLSLVPPGETDILGNPAGQGFVDLNGVRYDFILNAACQKIFGGVQANGSMADGSDGRVDSFIPPEDWETDTAAGWDPPLVDIDIGDDSWRAEAGSEHFVGGENVELTLEQSSVISFTNDGSRVTGEAIFYSAFNFEELETASGTFEFYCP